MRKMVMTVLALWLIAVTLTSPLLAIEPQGQSAKPAPPPPLAIKVGDTAPDFTLLTWDGAGPPKAVSLRDFRGKKNVALAFYVFAFTGG